jgi:hypothetical protein
LGVKYTGREADHSLLPSPEVKCTRSYASPTPIRLQSVLFKLSLTLNDV